MWKTLKIRVEKSLKSAAEEYKISKKVQRVILKQIREDKVLPILTLPRKCEVEFSVQKEGKRNTVCLQIGPRDWSFDFRTGELEGCGTFLL